MSREPKRKADKQRISLRSERGIALLIVLVLSAVSLALITALLYMITVGTKTSGMHKRYRSALEAGVAGSDLIFQVIDQRDNASIASFLSSLQTISGTSNISPSCSGTLYSGGTATSVSGAATKILASGTTWNNCGSTTLVADSSDYDYKFVLGSDPQYTVYAKIVDVREGNTGGAGSSATTSSTHNLVLSPVVSNSGGGGEIASPSIPYQYEIEVDAENNANPTERAKLSILYQY